MGYEGGSASTLHPPYPNPNPNLHPSPPISCRLSYNWQHDGIRDKSKPGVRVRVRVRVRVKVKVMIGGCGVVSEARIVVRDRVGVSLRGSFPCRASMIQAGDTCSKSPISSIEGSIIPLYRAKSGKDESKPMP